MSCRAPSSLGALVVLSMLAVGPALAEEPPAATPAVAVPAVKLLPCQVAGLDRPGMCGTLEVYENRARRSGRKIPLAIVVVPALSGEKTEDPLVFVHGGPGASAISTAAMMAAEYAEINQTRDILLTDQRGTGQSYPLDIDLFGPPDRLEGLLGEFMPPKAACEGARKLAATADLAQYTTPVAADDLDDVRAALGYSKLNLIGASYGTRVVLAYLRQHPDRVRTATLHGVSRLDDHLPLRSPVNVDRVLDELCRECAATPSCQERFPKLREEIAKVLAGLEKGPAQVKVLHPATGELVTVPLSRELAGEAVRYLLYYPRLTQQLPVILHQAAQGDLGPLAEMAVFGRLSIVGSGSHGMFLAVMCSEDVAFIDVKEGEKLAAGTVMGPARLRQLKAACECFPKAPLPAGYAEPVRSEAPVLIVTGALDPATPPANAEHVARTLPNSLNVTVPFAGHDVDGLENAGCVTTMLTALVEKGSTAGLDTSCLATVKRPPFLTEPFPTTVVELPEAELAKLAGSYTVEGAPLDIPIALVGKRLRIDMPGGQRLLLAPVSPTRFKVVGPPGAYAVFQVAEGSPTRVELVNGGQVMLAMNAQQPDRAETR